MSFLAEATARRVMTLSVPRAATHSAPRAANAAFSTSVTFQKSAVDSAKDTLKGVDRAVSDKLVDGINISSSVAGKIKEAAEEVTQGNSTGATAELRGEASGKASEVSGEAKGFASEAAGKAKGAAGKVAGKAKGAANEAAGKAKGAAEQAQRNL
ncbi:hypothetical protein QBC37DRAFT_46116 [Rhypophila decipiens]|uniref:Uncharacterized protein n=1 Tax=Rhypophila decipiens TaxID=261697 RepID=A0AAN7B9C1_9PEZI|nr:hypothetical protein QBC37DRAFT_46116 [Rhypophila decipiens]